MTLKAACVWSGRRGCSGGRQSGAFKLPFLYDSGWRCPGFSGGGQRAAPLSARIFFQSFSLVFSSSFAYTGWHADRSSPFCSQTLDWLAGALRDGGHTRYALGRALCERTGWRNPKGALCLSAAAKALPALAERLGLGPAPPREAPCMVPGAAAPADGVPDTRVNCPLEDLGPVWLDPVGDAGDRRLWEAMMARRHPQGWARSPGGQMRYWIRSERHGVLGGIGFGSATWQLRARDEWTGWSADARAANIRRVLCCHRFLVLPGVRVHGLASQVLRMATERVADDWCRMSD